MSFDAALPPFRERAPWRGGDLQTARNLLTFNRGTPPLPAGERLWFEMADGDRLTGVLHRPCDATGRPLAVLIHGLAGSEDSHYVVATAAHLLSRGWPVLRLDLRGAGPARDTCRDGYHAGRTEDFAVLLDALAPQGQGIVAVGYSLGANMLLKYLGERGAAAGLRAAVSVSAPLDLAAASRRFLAPRNRFYQSWLLGHMKRDALESALRLSSDERRAIVRSGTVFEFDDRFVAPRHGFADAGDYYRRCSAENFLAGIGTPTLLLHADNDPWIPPDAHRTAADVANAKITMVLTRGGGHVGFHGPRAQAAGRWHDAAIAHFLTLAVQEGAVPAGGGAAS